MEKNIGLNVEENKIRSNNDVFGIAIKEVLLLYISQIDNNFIKELFVDNFIHIELYNDKDTYMTIFSSEDRIQIIINDLEKIFFFDDNKFIIKYKQIIGSLFYGAYTIRSVYRKDYLIEQELCFNDYELKELVIKNEYQYIFGFLIPKKNTIVDTLGFNWIGGNG